MFDVAIIGCGPVGGFAANLAWKLAAVVKGDAPDALLDSYQPERDPHVRAVISAAVSAGRYICVLDPQAAAARDTEMRESAKVMKQGTAADLIPAISTGILALGTAGAGERFIQPRVGGKLLDDVTGGGWRLFARHAVAAPGDVTVVALDALDDGGAIAGWLDARGADALLLRPDHYVFGTYVSGAGEPADLIALRDALIAGSVSQEIAA